jgi:hypothetical protein
MVFLLTDLNARRNIYSTVCPWLSLKMTAYTCKHPAFFVQSTYMFYPMLILEDFEIRLHETFILISVIVRIEIFCMLFILFLLYMHLQDI